MEENIWEAGAMLQIGILATTDAGSPTPSSGHDQAGWLHCIAVSAGLKDSVDWIGGDATGMVATRNVDVAIVTPGTSNLVRHVRLGCPVMQSPSAFSAPSHA